MGRTILLTEAAGTPEERSTYYSYDLKGVLRETTKPNGTTLTYSYTPLGFLDSLRSSDGTVAYQYRNDRLGRQTHATDLRTGQTTEKQYTPHGDLLQERLASGYTIRADYDSRGRRQALFLPDGSSIQYGHDALYLRTVIRLNAQGSQLYQHRFIRYAQNGALLEEELIGKLGSAQRHYNFAGQLQEILSPYHRHAVDERDSVGNILKAHFDQTQYAYSYNALYELIVDEAHTYNYDANLCRIAKDQESAPVNVLFELSSLPYDPNGNPTHWDQGECTFDALDRLTQVEWSDRRVEYTYDAAHRRLSKRLLSKAPSGWQETQQQYFLYDGANEIGTIDGHGEIRELRILGLMRQAELGSAIALELYGQVYLPLHNLMGSICGTVPVTAPASKVIYHQTPFGEEAQEIYISPWRFSAKRVDPETGLVYYGRRYYAPPLGRWLTPDPIGFTDSLNPYCLRKKQPAALYRFIWSLCR
jgi:RHS repeat-associated protein